MTTKTLFQRWKQLIIRLVARSTDIIPATKLHAGQPYFLAYILKHPVHTVTITRNLFAHPYR